MNYLDWQRNPSDGNVMTDWDQFKGSTESQLKGNEFAEEASKSDYKEMRGSFIFDSKTLGDTIQINYCFDEVRSLPSKNIVIEHKSVILRDDEDVTTKEYLTDCVTQVGFYKALHEFSNKQYRTARFYEEAGWPVHTLNLSFKPIEFLLHIGDKWYKINTKDPSEILRYYITKIKASKDFQKSRAFDLKYHNKSWNYFKKFITRRVTKAL
jgi:hypothetical protein